MPKNEIKTETETVTNCHTYENLSEVNDVYDVMKWFYQAFGILKKDELGLERFDKSKSLEDERDQVLKEKGWYEQYQNFLKYKMTKKDCKLIWKAFQTFSNEEFLPLKGEIFSWAKWHYSIDGVLARLNVSEYGDNAEIIQVLRGTLLCELQKRKVK
jgi:hypothetical protein